MITVVCCITNRKMFNDCLGGSLKKQNVKYKFISAPTNISLTASYNSVLGKIKTRYVAFIHQDILMLEKNWLKKAERLCNEVSLGVAGVAGRSWGNKCEGYIVHYTKLKNKKCKYYGKFYDGQVYAAYELYVNQGAKFKHPRLTMTLDTMVLIVSTRVFKKCPFDEKIPRLMGVDFCLSIKHNLNLNAYVLPLKTWHHPFSREYARKHYGYKSPFHTLKQNVKTNRMIKRKWNGIFNLIFSTCNLDRCPKCRSNPCICAKPFNMRQTISYKKRKMRKIRVAVVGIGAMGRGILQVIRANPDMKVVGISDINEIVLQRAKDLVPKNTVITKNPIKMLNMKPKPDVLVDATTSIVGAVRFNKKAMDKKINVVLMNAEVDQIFGRLLARYAKKRKVILTSDAGDQYGVLIRDAEAIKSMGLEIVMSGNNKGYLDRYANPTIQKPFCEKLRLNLKPCTAYTDGTKLAIEMALMANALDLELLQKGMVGPRAHHVNDALKLFDLDRARKIGGVVDYVLGASPSGSVFTIAYSNDSENKFYLGYYKMGKGPYYLFLRPYHLCHFETPYAIRKVMIDKKPVLVQKRRVLEVGSYAKKNLRAGTRLDGIGGYCLYGLLEKPSSLPIALSNNVILKVDKKIDEAIMWNDVKFPKGDIRLTLWREQGED